MARKIFIIDTEKVEKDFTKGKILAYAKELEISDIGALAYLYFFNNVSISSLNDLKKDCGRAMYRKFAQGFNEMLKEYSDLNTKDAEKILEELEKTQKQYEQVVEQNQSLQKELNQCKRSMVYKINRRLIKEKADALAKTLELKYILKQIWNIVEHQINFNANNTDKTYTVNDLKKIQQKISEVLPA